MLEKIIELLSLWVTKEPSASLLLFATCILIFASLLSDKRDTLNVSTLTSALSKSVWFILIIGFFYFLLNFSRVAFAPIANSIFIDEEVAQQILNAKKMWGGNIKQADLKVDFSYEEQSIKEIINKDNKISYISIAEKKAIDQEGIVGFDGAVDIRIKNLVTNTYTATAKYKYQILNASDKIVNADFSFPIFPNRYYENVKIYLNNEDIQFDVQSNKLSWVTVMAANQTAFVEIVYTTRGMNSFIYSISTPRTINDFFLSMSIDVKNITVLAKPGGNSIQVNSILTETGKNIVWQIDNSIMATDLGVFIKPVPNKLLTHLRSVVIVEYAKKGLMLYAIVLAMTFVIMREKINMWNYSIMIAAYSSQYFGIMGLDLLKIDYRISIILFAFIVIFIAQKIFNNLSRSSYIVMLIITIVFCLGYPFAGLLEKGRPRDTFEMLLYLLILMYFFFFTLTVRIKRIENRSN